jgi:hypothetical protein
LLPSQDFDPVAGQGREEFLFPASLLGFDQFAGTVKHIRQEFLGRRMAGRFLLLHDAGHAYLEELVEVRAHDGEEPDALQEGDGIVFGELEDSTVKT